jgi:PAS domain S-box-containing protein
VDRTQTVEELRDALEKAEAERRHYQDLFAFAPDGYLVTDPEGVLLEANHAAAGMLGISLQSSSGIPLADLIAPEDRAAFCSCLAEQGASGAPGECEARLPSGTGGPFHASLRVDARRDPEGRPLALRWLIRDITRRKQAEEAQARFAAILEATTDFVGMADREERPLHLNRAGRKMLGRDEQGDLCDDSIFACHPEWVQKILREEAIPAARRDGAWSGETALLGPDGREIPVSQVVLAHKSAGGDVEFISTIARDITQRKRMEEALRRAHEERYRLLLDSLPIAVYTCDAEGRVDLFNEQAVALWGRRPESGKDLWCGSWRIFRPDGSPLPLDQCPMAVALREGRRVVDQEIVIERPDGERVWVLPFPQPLHDADGAVAGAVNVLMDVSPLKGAEQALRRAHDELETRVQERTADLRAAVRALEESRERFSLVFRASPVAISISTLDEGRFIDANDSFLRQVDYRREEVIGRTSVELGMWEPGDRARFIEEMRRERSRSGQEVPYRTRSGEQRAAFGYAELIQLDGRECLLALMHDVTERKQMEEALKASEERYRRIVELADEGIWAIDAQTRTTYVNPRMAAMLGYSVEEMLGRSAYEFVDPAGQAEAERQWELRLRGVADRSDSCLRRKDGSRLWVIACTTTLLDEDGRFAGAFGMLTDITERKRAEESQARFVAILEATTDLVGMADMQGRRLYINHAGRKLRGFGDDEDLSTTSIFDGHPEWAKQILREEAIPTAVREGAWSGETALLCRDGREIPVSQLILAHKNAAGAVEFISTIARDITQRKRAETQLREAEHVARGQTAALARTLNALTERPELDTFLGQLLASIAEQLDAHCTVLWFYDAEEDALALHMTSDGGRVPADQPYVLREIPVWRELVQTRRPLLIEDIRTDPRIPIRERLLARGIRTLLLIPLFLGEEPIGLLNVASTEPRTYQPEEMELARALGQQATLAVQLTRLAQHEQQSAVLRERNRMAREIHDTLAQGFTGILLQLEAAEYVLTTRPEEARTCLVRAQNQARESLAEARRSVWALRPRALELDELPDALNGLARQMTVGTSTRAECRVHGPARDLPDDVESELLRIGLEALTNALKYAGASTVHIDLHFEPETIRLSVRDDGRGFDPTDQSARAGFGLISMRERAERLGGRLTISSRPGAGTEVIVAAPTPGRPAGAP